MCLSVSDTEVGATFFVRSPSLLWGMSGASAGILFHTGLFPFSVADSVLLVPLLQGPLAPALRGPRPTAVGGLGPPLWRAPPPALWGPFLIQESLQGPPAMVGRAVPSAGGRALASPLRRKLSSLFVLLPPLQSGVCAAGAFPALFRGPPLGAVGHHPLWGRLSPSLWCPVLGSASPTVGFSRSSIPCVMLIGLSAILSAAFWVFPVCPLFPML